jgi:hypothetical protein
MTDNTRRTFLGTLASTVTVGLAGCSGGDGGDTDTSTGTPAMTDSMDDSTTSDGMGGMGETTTTEGSMSGPLTFEVTVRNVSEAGTITTSEGDDVAVPLSPTVYAVHTDEVQAFQAGESASAGIEALAEDGRPATLAEEVSGVEGVPAAGAATSPDGASGNGPLMPGQSYSFSVEAERGHRLTLATMFVQSNDLFYATDPEGVALFPDGEPVTGNVADHLTLWDAGTEQNQEPGVGPDQAPRQSSTDTGPTEDATIRPVSEVDDGYSYPDTSDVIEVVVTTM